MPYNDHITARDRLRPARGPRKDHDKLHAFIIIVLIVVAYKLLTL